MLLCFQSLVAVRLPEQMIEDKRFSEVIRKSCEEAKKENKGKNLQIDTAFVETTVKRLLKKLLTLALKFLKKR